MAVTFFSRVTGAGLGIAMGIAAVGAAVWGALETRTQVEFVTLHHMAVLDVKSDKVTKGDADYKEGWACFMVRPRKARLVRSDLLRDEYGNTMLACFWEEPLP